MKYLLVIVMLMGILKLVPVASTFAQDSATESAKIKVESVNPGSFLYPVKRFFENIQLNYLSGGKDKKAKTMSNMLDTRFKELVYVSKNKRVDDFEKASSRYVTTLQTIAKDYHAEDKDLNKQLASYKPVLEEQLKKYEGDYAYWSFIKQAIEVTDSYK